MTYNCSEELDISEVREPSFAKHISKGEKKFLCLQTTEANSAANSKLCVIVESP